MNIIFLDIDGVLNNKDTFITQEKCFVETGKELLEIDPVMVKRLAQIVKRTNSQIVISSSWRCGWEPKYEKCSNRCKRLIDLLNEHGLQILDKTPVMKSGLRQDEIKQWLVDHVDVDNFVILDDETSFLMDFVGTRLVKTNCIPDGVMLQDIAEATGLMDEHVKRAIEILLNV